MNDENNVSSEVITFEDFMKVDIRAGRIDAAEAIPRSELLKLQVDLGELGTRQVLARIAKTHAPETLINLTTLFVVNLQSREMKGQVSNGMVLVAPHAMGITLISLSGTVRPGTRLG